MLAAHAFGFRWSGGGRDKRSLEDAEPKIFIPKAPWHAPSRQRRPGDHGTCRFPRARHMYFLSSLEFLSSCVANTCVNGGQCVEAPHGSRCFCRPPFHGPFCQCESPAFVSWISWRQGMEIGF